MKPTDKPTIKMVEQVLLKARKLGYIDMDDELLFRVAANVHATLPAASLEDKVLVPRGEVERMRDELAVVKANRDWHSTNSEALRKRLEQTEQRQKALAEKWRRATSPAGHAAMAKHECADELDPPGGE